VKENERGIGLGEYFTTEDKGDSHSNDEEEDGVRDEPRELHHPTP
jgi:hypothetical protein